MHILFFSSHHYDEDSFRASLAHGGYSSGLAFQRTHLEAQAVSLASGLRVVYPFVNDCLNAEVLKALAAGGTRLIALRSADFNHVDLPVTQRLGLAMMRVPACSPHAMAEHAVGMILTLDRRLHCAYNRTREDDFSLDGLLGFDLAGKTVGVVDTGQIGQAFARIMAGFGCQLPAFDPFPQASLAALGARYVPLPELLAQADIVSLHCPLSADTHHLIDASALAGMKPGAMLINTSRGGLIDSPALIGVLKTGQLDHLGPDVYEKEADLFFEDRSADALQDDVLARLLSFPSVIVTAHQVFFTREVLVGIADTTLANMATWAAGAPADVVPAQAGRPDYRDF